MSVQAILFDKSLWKQKHAKLWVRDHGYKQLKPVHITQKKFRYRIKDPRRFKKYRTKKVGIGIDLILGF